MSALTAEQFRDLCHDVQALRSSLDSCRDSEAPAEAERLLRRVGELRAATLKRANRALSKLRDDVIYGAMLSHARRGHVDPPTVPCERCRHALCFVRKDPDRTAYQCLHESCQKYGVGVFVVDGAAS